LEVFVVLRNAEELEDNAKDGNSCEKIVFVVVVELKEELGSSQAVNCCHKLPFQCLELWN